MERFRIECNHLLPLFLLIPPCDRLELLHHTYYHVCGLRQRQLLPQTDTCSTVEASNACQLNLSSHELRSLTECIPILVAALGFPICRDDSLQRLGQMSPSIGGVRRRDSSPVGPF